MFNLQYKLLKKKQLLGLSSFQFLAFFRRLLVYAFLSIYLVKVLGLNTTELTLIGSLPMIVSATAQSFLWGPLLDRIQRSHWFVIIGEIFAAILHIIAYYFLNQTLDTGDFHKAGWVVILSFVVIELPWSASNVGWSAMIAERTESAEQTRLNGQLSIIGGFGGVFGAQIGGLYYQSGDGFSDGTLFYIAAIVMVVSAVSVLFSIDPGNTKLNSYIEDNIEIEAEMSDLNIEIRSQYILFLTALVIINFASNGLFIITNVYLANENGFNASDFDIALYANMRSIFSMIAGIILGSKFLKISDNNLMVLATLFVGFAQLWLVFAPTFYLTLISSALLGGSFVIIQVSSYTIVAKLIPPEFKGRMFGIYNASFFLSWGIGGTVLFGPLSDFLIGRGLKPVDAYKYSFLTATVIIFLGLLVLFKFNRRNILNPNIEPESLSD